MRTARQQHGPVFQQGLHLVGHLIEGGSKRPQLQGTGLRQTLRQPSLADFPGRPRQQVEPAGREITAPTRLSLLSEAGTAVVKERVEELRDGKEAGDTESEQERLGGGGVVVTVTVAPHVTVPPGPVAVPV